MKDELQSVEVKYVLCMYLLKYQHLHMTMNISSYNTRH